MCHLLRMFCWDCCWYLFIYFFYFHKQRRTTSIICCCTLKDEHVRRARPPPLHSRSMKRSSGPCDFWRFSGALLKRMWGNDPAAQRRDPRWLPDVRFKEVRKLACVPSDFSIRLVMSGEHTVGQEVSYLHLFKHLIALLCVRVGVRCNFIFNKSFPQCDLLNGLCCAEYTLAGWSQPLSVWGVANYFVRAEFLHFSCPILPPPRLWVYKNTFTACAALLSALTSLQRSQCTL